MPRKSPPNKALIVDDDITIRIAMRSVLEGLNFDVTEAADGEEALLRFAEIEPHIIVLDIEMPNLDGLSACAEIRKRPNGKNIPIIMSTGMDDEVSINKAYEVGATDFIIKPITWPVFGHRIRYILRASQAINDFRLAEQLALRLGKVIESSSNEIYIADTKTLRLKQLNASARENLGYAETEYSALRLTDIIMAYGQRFISELISRLEDSSRPEAFLNSDIQRKDGTFYPAEIRLQRSPGEDGDLIVAIVQDITERKQNEDRMRQLAYFDSLTGLPNRTLFTEQLEQMLESANRNQFKLAILFIDLDNFKRINDSLGHTVGDALLKEISKRLLTCIRQSDLVSRYVDPNTEISVSRLGGDEFTIVLNKIEDTEVAAIVAKRLLNTLSRPMTLEGHEIVVTPSIGIALAPLDSDSVENLLKHADTAMYHAKNNGKNNYQYYSSTMNAMGVQRLSLESELRRALTNNELVVFYQPQVNVQTGKIVGAEALVRWQHPKHGLVAPDYFISLAEEMGIVVELGNQILLESCQQVKQWQDKGFALEKIAVNLSSLQFSQPDLISTIQNTLSATGLSAEYVELELTESIIMKNLESTIKVLEELKNMGISISVDDFGTGYSSLNYLKRFPLDELKIDKSFIVDIDTDAHNAGIVTAIIAMAKSLKLSLVAEGIETEKQLKFIREAGVVTVQGFFFSKPLPARDFEKLLGRQGFLGCLDKCEVA
ncbi:MAG: EAL domain-containing protein [Pseudomonadales bacterium]|nr:EAL domain-containing protein [Pseudomonadales bacterium]